MPAAAIGAVAAIGGSLISVNASSSAAKKAASSAKSELDFNKAQYERWQEVFGPIQDNLSEYYQSLTPDYYEAAGLQAFEKENQAQMTTLNEQLAQRGLTGSGLEATLNRENAIDTAEQRAAIRVDAPAKAAAEQLNFLQVGMGQQSNINQTYSQALANQTATAQQNSNAASLASAQATSSAISTVGTALSDYWSKK